MPITNIGSYPPVMQAFIDHWTAVNAALGLPANALKLKGGYDLAAFTADRTAIVNAIAAVISASNTQQGNANLLLTAKNSFRARLTQFRATVQGQLDSTKYVTMLPTLPNNSSVESRFLAPFIDMGDVWNLINTEVTPGFTPPLTLAGGYALAAFLTDLTALRGAFVAVTQADNAAQNVRANRDGLLKPADTRMKQYRQAVVGKLAPGNPLLNTIPAYSAPNTGPAADAVAAAGQWNVATSEAVLTWDASTLPDNVFNKYDVRTAPGPTYRIKDEQSISDGLDSSANTTYSTDVGLTVSGATALFRVYVITNGGRERGSNTVKVIRP